MTRGGRGNGSDTVANAIFGTNGKDSLNGFGLSFFLRRGRGDEIYYVDERNNGGTDRAISWIDYSLGRQVENLTLDGNGSGAGGTVIGSQSNDDPDSGDSWTYTITQDLDQKFQTVGNQLVLRDGASLDYEAEGARSVTIRVTDCSGASHTETFAITFNDVAEMNSGALRRAFYVRRALSALVTL